MQNSKIVFHLISRIVWFCFLFISFYFSIDWMKYSIGVIICILALYNVTLAYLFYFTKLNSITPAIKKIWNSKKDETSQFNFIFDCVFVLADYYVLINHASYKITAIYGVATLATLLITNKSHKMRSEYRKNNLVLG